MPFYIIFALAIALLAVIFALQNNISVPLSLLVWETRGSLALVILAALAIGVMIGLLVALPAIVKRGWRTSRMQKQTASLEDQLLEKDRQVSAESHRARGLQHSYQTLLAALNLTESTTGLLDGRILPQTLEALVQQMNQQPQSTAGQAVALLLLEAQPVQPSPPTNAALWQAVAAALQHSTTTGSWLYSTGGGQFMCTLTGLDTTAANQYAERLKHTLTDAPLRLSSGQQAQVDVSIGGVVADRAHPVRQAQTLENQAKAALAQAKSRGRNRIRIHTVEPGSAGP